MAKEIFPKHGPELEEDLSALAQSAETAEEEDLAEELELERQKDRNQIRLQEIVENSKANLKEAAKEVAKEEVKKYAGQAVRKLGKQAVRSGSTWLARSGIVSTLTATAEFWVPVLLILLAFLFVMFFSIATVVYACHSDNWTVWVVRKASQVANITSLGNVPNLEEVCQEYFGRDILKNTNYTQVPTEQAPEPGSELVSITGIPTTAPNPFLRPCMLERIQNIYARAQQHNIDFEITSAYRPGAVTSNGTPSAHSFGEAVDIAIRPPYPPYNLGEYLADSAFQVKIATLVSLSVAEGFVPPQGDTLDEYNKPTENATGGHIHLEFNRIAGNVSYCRDAL